MTLRVCFAALLVSVLAALLSELGFRQKRLFAVLSLVLIFSMLAEGIGKLFSSAVSLVDMAGVGEAAKCAIKAVGVGYVFGFTADVCDELGERGIANAVTLGARVEIFLIALPYFEKTVKLGIELLK